MNNTRAEKLFQRTALCKINYGITYKQMAKEIGFTRGVMETFTGKKHAMTDENLDKLVTYLDSLEQERNNNENTNTQNILSSRDS